MSNKSQQCINQAFEILGRRWNGLIVTCLLQGEKRFSDIAETVPQISSRMLAQRLKELEEFGLVNRTVYPETPVRIIYSLSESGQGLKPVIDKLYKWAENCFCKDKD